ncbi:MAG: hypothetical protein AB1721_00340 [Patescibacteria group bacterium]
MNISLIYASIISFVIVIILMIQYLVSVCRAAEKIWPNSGDPLSMSQMLLASLQANAQILFGILALFILFVLMEEKIISSEAGLPIFSALAAYLLGKGFKESSFLNKNKKNEKGEK